MRLAKFRFTALVAALVTCLAVAGLLAAQGPVAVTAAAQAAQGQAVFARSCAGCHTADSAKPATVDIPSGIPIPLAGPKFIQKWRTAGDLYLKLVWTMPANKINSLPEEDYVRLVAYLLQVNGRLPSAPMTTNLAALHTVIADPRAVVADRPEAGVTTKGFYTNAQAERGKTYFYGNCSLCHTDVPGERMPPPGRGLTTGLRPSFPNLATLRLGERYLTVGDLFNKVAKSMPQHASNQLSTGTYVDLVAYFLKLNGQPSGSYPLIANEIAMKSMTIPEPGFETLFNGKDFGGWKFVLGANCGDPGCAKTSPAPTFTIKDGVITSTGIPIGFMYPEARYHDFTLRLEYRYPRPERLEFDEDFQGNSGYILFIDRPFVWPVTLEIQGGNTRVLSVISAGPPVKFMQDNDARRRVRRPVGEWNTIEIDSHNGQIKSSLNGTLISTVTEHQFTEPGFIGFQSEGAPIQWRNIRIKAE